MSVEGEGVEGGGNKEQWGDKQIMKRNFRYTCTGNDYMSYFTSLVPRLSPRANEKSTGSDGKLGGAWERGYYFTFLWFSLYL